MTSELIKYINQYGGFCRDCADNVGVCPFSGMPCDPKSTNAVIKHTLAALDYGIKHGFIENPFAHAVPDVPELARYDLTYNMPFGEDADISEDVDGDYVRYDQAAAIIAAERQSAVAAEADNKRLREALTKISKGSYDGLEVTNLSKKHMKDIARAALEGSKK